MKHTLISVFLVANLVSQFLYSQEDTIQNKHVFIFKTDVIIPVLLAIFANQNPQNESFLFLTATFEKNLKLNNSIQLSGFYFNYKNSNTENNIQTKLEEQKFRIESQYKIFLSKRKEQKGFFSGLYTGFWKYNYLGKLTYYNSPYSNYSSHTTKFNELCVNVGPIFGYQSYLKDRIAFEFIFGFGYRQRILYKQEAPEGFQYNGSKFDALFAINIGYKFRLKK